MDMMGGADVLGDELEGYDELSGDVLGMALVGEQARQMRRAQRQRPRWRQQLAPGVPTPDYGVFPVPLTALANNGIFTAAIANIQYRTVAQVPFRGERLLTRVARVGASATGALVLAQNGVFVGIRPQIGVLGAINLEDYTSQAFGVRLVMQQATQGAEINIFSFVSPTLTGTDTLALSIQILGRVAR